MSNQKERSSWPEEQAGDRPPPRNGMAVAALLLGVLSIPGVLLLGILDIVPALLGVVLGIMAIRQVRSGIATRRGYAIIGTVTGGLGIVLMAVLLVLNAREISSCKAKIGHTPSRAELTKCVSNKS